MVGNVKKKLFVLNIHHTRMEFLHWSKTTQFTDANKAKINYGKSFIHVCAISHTFSLVLSHRAKVF